MPELKNERWKITFDDEVIGDNGKVMRPATVEYLHGVASIDNDELVVVYYGKADGELVELERKGYKTSKIKKWEKVGS